MQAAQSASHKCVNCRENKMRWNLIVVGVVAVGAAVYLAGNAVGQNSGGGAQQPSADEMKAMMDGMQKYMAGIKPGKHHESLNHFVGSWETTMKMWWGGPGSPPIVTKGTSEAKWVLGGRFIKDEYKGKMPDMTGATKEIDYEGIGLTGYNNERNMYEQSWVSSAQTNMLTMKGGVDPSGKVFTFYGEMDEVMLGVVGRMVKYVTLIVDKDKHVFEIIDLHAGDGYKVVEITYTRKK